MNKLFFIICLISIIYLPSYSYSYENENKSKMEVLYAIKNFAKDFCIETPLEGEGINFESKGKVTAETKKLIKKIADLNIIANSSISIDKYTGLVRDQLPDEIKDRRKCHKDLWKDLQKIFFSSNYEDNSTATSQTESAATHASSDAGSSSLTSKKGACAAWAGPGGTNSTCASLDGKGVSTRAAIDGANSAGVK